MFIESRPSRSWYQRRAAFWGATCVSHAAPCWLVKGAGKCPGEAISIFFTDGASGVFYKSIPLPGVPTDVTLSPDRKWLAVIYTASDSSGGHIAIYAIDSFGDLSLTATSGPVGVASFYGVAISQ